MLKYNTQSKWKYLYTYCNVCIREQYLYRYVSYHARPWVFPNERVAQNLSEFAHTKR